MVFLGRWSPQHRAALAAARLRRECDPLMLASDALLAVNASLQRLIIDRCSGLPPHVTGLPTKDPP